MIPLLIAVLLQPSPERRPFRAEIRIEEGLEGADRVEESSAILILREGGSCSIETAGNRGRRRSFQDPAADASRFHPVELWALEASEWGRFFESSREEPAAERALPGKVVDLQGLERPAIRATPAARSVAQADAREGGSDLEGIRLVPRSDALRKRFPSLVAWVEKGSGRLSRVEADLGRRRLVCVRVSFREEERR